MQHLNTNITGLNQQQVEDSRNRYGKNEVIIKKENPFVTSLVNAVKEPMLLLLLAASIIYFIYGDLAEGIFLVVAIFLVSSISLYQESRSRHALEALKSLTQPRSRVIRESKVQEIQSGDIVMGDYIIVEEGELIPADGLIMQANDFGVNESILTGESLPVLKEATSEDNVIYQGTQVVSGLAIGRVTRIGNQTKVGQIGKSLQELKEVKSPLQIQINDFVKKMALAGLFFFTIIWIINYSDSGSILESLLKALTLAMSILPEEIPVAFATFMALGSWRLMQVGIIVKQTKTVETLGSATVICVDKTGTITKNEMTLAKVYVHDKREIADITDAKAVENVIDIAMWASEPIPFDPMEHAIHHAYAAISASDTRPFFRMVQEYPLSGRPPLMTHIFRNEKDGRQIIAAKGAPEALISLSDLTADEKEMIMRAFTKLASEGYRVLGVGEAKIAGQEYPKDQHEFRFSFKGLVAFYDPPKKNIKSVLQSFYKAGIVVKIITGDNAATTTTIARQVEFRGIENSVSGEALMSLSKEALSDTVRHTNIFTRMFPDAKLKIIQALMAQNQIVAMTGDGVNDSPALKAAHIGVAMGKKGTEIAKQASALILADDDLARMVDAVAMGRKIYNNLKKAVQYIISIHIPLILIVFIPLVLGWIYPAIFTPVHIILFELIMGPTCSIIYENEPMEKYLMNQGPRKFSASFFNLRELATSILQGLVITAGLIFIYWVAAGKGESQETTTAMVFITLIASNILLTLVNRSFYYSIFTTFRYKNKLIPLIVCITILLTTLIFAVPTLRSFFEFDTVDARQTVLCISAGSVSVIWFEVYKAFKRALRERNNENIPEIEKTSLI